MSKNPKVSLQDPNQIISRTFDDDNDAQRVYIVGGSSYIPGNTTNAPNQIEKIHTVEVKEINIPTIVKEPEIIKVPEIIQKIEKIEIPVIVKETQIEQVEKVIVAQEIKTLEIPKYIEIPKIIEVVKQKDITNFEKIVLIAQTVSILGILLIQLFKK